MSRAWTALGLGAALLMSLAGGCGEVPWGNGGLGDELPADAFDTEGLVFVLGAEDLQTASSKLDRVVSEAWADGVPLTGRAGVVDLEGHEISVEWHAMRVELGAVKLALDDEGITLSVGVRVPTSELRVEGAQTVACSPTVSIDDAQLSLHATLGSDKSGRVQAALSETPSLRGEELDVDWSGCHDEVSAPAFDALSLLLWDALADNAAEVLGPELIAALPGALGLDVALGVATTTAVDEIGAGLVRVSVEARSSSSGGAWRVVQGRLVVPFAVGLGAEAHPCVPAAELPEITALTAPEITPGPRGATLVSASAIRRGLATLWLSGALCGDHATAERSLTVATLGPGWAPLAALPRATPLTLSLWPRALPDISLDAAPGEGELLVSTGPMDVDVFGELDGASVRLFSLSIDADVAVTLTVSAQGLLSSQVRDLTLRAGETRAGLLAPPDAAIADAVVTPLVRALLDDRQLLQLPPRAGPTRAEPRGDYLAIPQ